MMPDEKITDKVVVGDVSEDVTTDEADKAETPWLPKLKHV